MDSSISGSSFSPRESDSTSSSPDFAAPSKTNSTGTVTTGTLKSATASVRLRAVCLIPRELGD